MKGEVDGERQGESSPQYIYSAGKVRGRGGVNEGKKFQGPPRWKRRIIFKEIGGKSFEKGTWGGWGGGGGGGLEKFCLNAGKQ